MERRTRCVHDIVGTAQPTDMPGKPPQCLGTETCILHREGDYCITTFPKTGTTLLSFICHLLRCDGIDEENLTNFEDICQVVPHTSSAWFINQDINADQPGTSRLFKSHRPLQQVAYLPGAEWVKYIVTIRDPTTTLLSLYQHRLSRGRFRSPPPNLLEYARSPAWLDEHMEGCMPSIWDYYISFWKCRFIFIYAIC